MNDPEKSQPETSLEPLRRRVQSLQFAVFSRPDPSGNAERIAELAQAQRELEELSKEVIGTRDGEASTPCPDDAAPPSPRETFLGPDTTGLDVAVQLCMDPLPTGIYHLLDSQKEPLLKVVIQNVYGTTKRVRVRAHLEGISAETVQTLEIKGPQPVDVPLLPRLFPERARHLREVQRATLHVIVEDLDANSIEKHATFDVTCLARTSSFNAVRDPNSGQRVDLTHYYGAWVTPYAEPVQQLIRRAADLVPGGQLLGYQGTREQVTDQVKALYEALAEAKIKYVHSVIDYGSGTHLVTQRTRLPRESLRRRSANCIDGTVLMASLLEGSSLNPAIVVVPGHAFVGWEQSPASGRWKFLETTLVGDADFAAACHSAEQQYNRLQNSARLHPLDVLRRRNIWPME